MTTEEPVYVKSGLTWISEARAEQVRGRHSIPQDVTDHMPGDIATAAACLLDYVAATLSRSFKAEQYEEDGHPNWPWSDVSWDELVARGPRWVLAHAGALTAAEIDREQAVERIL